MKIYLYDDTFEGLLTSIYDAFYSNGSPPTSIYGKSQTNTPLLLGNIVEISTDINKFKKVKNAIINKINFLSLKKIYFVFLSNYEDKGIIFNYLKAAFKLGPDVHDFLNVDVIRLVDNITKKVLNECHRFEGFIRFNQIEEKLLYSSIEPDNDILELIGDHFKNRFPREYFIIHDISRQKALIYNTNFYEIIDMDIETYEKLKFHNDEYTDLWKTYFKATTIQERKNLKLRCRMMPKRYWKHILETKI
ncbi:TIGR03915 family putative DNA repair protein [Clostridium beijerinckii]|uniref:TIGR03915 family putative DNA repair protein n=1 Tax=Clostridium beijerinckii TaxID=1520 RepID=UPI0022E0BEE8|nr:TIGR03915 family putative DNA repair protein [Clostridium beijerinckii]